MSTANDTSNGNPIVIARSTQIQAGDVMIALVYDFNFGTTAKPPDSTWNKYDGFDDQGPSYEVFYFWKLASALERGVEVRR